MQSNMTQEYAHSLFEYKDGSLYWKVRKAPHVKIGAKVGSPEVNGYETVYVDGRNWRIHRLVFLMQHGYLPEIVDHADCNPMNNDISNLRAATKSENQRNAGMFAHNTSGVKGVVWSKNAKKWLARIKVNGTAKHLGSFSCKEKAAEFVQLAREMLHGSFANHGLKGA